MPSILHKYILQNFLIFWNDSAAHYLLSHIRFCRKKFNCDGKTFVLRQQFQKKYCKGVGGQRQRGRSSAACRLDEKTVTKRRRNKRTEPDIFARLRHV